MERPSLVLVPEYFGALLFDRWTSRYLPFDQAAARVLLDMVRRPAFDVIAESPAEERGAITGFASYLVAQGFLRLDGRLGAARIERDPPPGHLLGPLAVHLEVTDSCNLACTHCFAGERRPCAEPLSIAELDALFGDLAGLGSFRLGLTGGEPLLREELFEILDAAIERGLHPCVTTNALLIDEHAARELGRRDLVWLNVSLDGATAGTNDAIRGAGVFSQVLEKVKLLGRHARFSLAFTLTRHNHHEVEACAALARSVGAQAAVFRPLYPVGRAARSPSLIPDFEDYVGALTRLEQIDDGGDLFVLDPFNPKARGERRGVVVAGPSCGAATTVASISAGGAVSPCSFLGPGCEAGNVRERSFEEIWREGSSFRRLRKLDGADRFGGGCRARAQFHSGTAFGVDPWHARQLARLGRYVGGGQLDHKNTVEESCL